MSIFLVFIVLLSLMQSHEDALIEASVKGNIKRVQKLLKINVEFNYMKQVIILCKAIMCQQFFQFLANKIFKFRNFSVLSIMLRS